MNSITKFHSIQLEFTLQYIIPIDYYIVKRYVKVASNDNIIKVEIKGIEWAKWQNYIRIYTTIYHTYPLCYIVKDSFR